MVPIRSLLVATDLSPFSLGAIDYALTLQLALGARVHLLYVKRPGRGRPRGPSETEAAEELRAVAGQAGGPGEVVCSVRSGAPASEICRYAREAGIDMILLTTHGRTGLRRMLAGGTAERVVRRSGVPVLTIRPQAEGGSFLRERDVERQLHLC